MSTEIINTDQPGIRETARFSLGEVVDLLLARTTIPSLSDIYSWLENSDFSVEDLAPYIGFKDGNYWRHRVCRNDFVEMLVLCWRPGHRTPIHDHNGSHGGVLVQEGRLWETIFNYDALRGLSYSSARDYSAGSVTGSDIPDIHQLGNPDVSEQNLVTIHVYAPPLGVLHTYKPGSTKIELYTPVDPD